MIVCDAQWWYRVCLKTCISCWYISEVSLHPRKGCDLSSQQYFKNLSLSSSLVDISLKLGFIPEEVDGVLVPHKSPVEQDQAHKNSPCLKIITWMFQMTIVMMLMVFGSVLLNKTSPIKIPLAWGWWQKEKKMMMMMKYWTKKILHESKYYTNQNLIPIRIRYKSESGTNLNPIQIWIWCKSEFNTNQNLIQIRKRYKSENDTNQNLIQIWTQYKSESNTNLNLIQI